MGDPQAKSRKDRRGNPSADPVGQDDRASHDNRADLLTKAETVTVAAIESGVTTLVEARETIAEFHSMVRREVEAGLTHGSSEPAPVSQLLSPMASLRMRRQCGRRSLRPGPTGRLKVRLRASSSLDVKCTVAGKSICFKPTNRRRIIGAGPKLRQSPIWTLTSTLALSRGRYGRAGTMAVR